jgi:hypothetical protein
MAVACGGPTHRPHSASNPKPARPGTDRFADLDSGAERGLFPFPGEEEEEGEVEVHAREDGRRPVARMEVTIPTTEPFVVHGTLPVPPGLDLDTPGRTPLALSPRRSDRDPVPAQVVIVTRSSTGEPDVIELSALIEPPAKLGRGGKLVLDVLRGDFELPGERPALPEASDQLLDPSGEGTLGLRARDVYGNTYAIDLRGDPLGPGHGSSRVIVSGPAQRTVRTYSTLVPVEESGTGDPLPHLMGVHAYLTTRAGDGRIGLDLRVHNGCTSGSRRSSPEESPLGILHWESLELVLPAQWTAVPLVTDPFVGQPYREGELTILPLVKPLPDGAMHMMPPQAQFQRRLTLVPKGVRPGAHLTLSGLAFCLPEKDLWSWWNPQTAHYFPQRTLLADWGEFRMGALRGRRALTTRVLDRRNALRRSLESGESQDGLLCGPLMGWSHPLGASIQGMTGGSGITFVDGHRIASAASVAGVEALMLEHRMNAARQSEAQWNREGDPVGVDLWLDDQGRVPFDFRTNGRMVTPPFRLPMFGGERPNPQVRAVHLGRLRAPYDQGSPHRADGRLSGAANDLISWMPHDGQHYARWTRPQMALAWLTSDPLAKDDLLLAAETFHLMFHGNEHVRASWSDGVTLREFEGLARTHPHHGLPLGRDQAWGIDVMCATYSLGDEGWRARHRDWFTRVAQLLVDGGMANGLLERIHIPKILGGRYDGAQAFEAMFLLHAQRCLIESVLRDSDEDLTQSVARLHQLGLDYLFWGPVWACVPSRGQSLCGPRWHFAVGPPGDWSAAPFCDESKYGPRYVPKDGFDGGVDVTYVWAPLEYGMLLAQGKRGPSLDDRYLRRSLACALAPRSWDALLTGVFTAAQRSSNDNSGNWTSLIGRIQSLR